MSSEQHEAGMRAARAYAQWHLGYRSWADAIVDAYRNPEQALERLRIEKGDDA